MNFKSVSEQGVQFSKKVNEDIIWSGKPLPVKMQRSKFFLHFYLVFMFALFSILLLIVISAEQVDQFTGIRKISWLFLLSAFSTIAAFLAFIEPMMRKKIRSQTSFFVTNYRVITVVNGKKLRIRETKIRKDTRIHCWQHKHSITIGFNTKNPLIKWHYNPFVEYASWAINLYPHYLYDVEENSYKKIQEVIHSIE